MSTINPDIGYPKWMISTQRQMMYGYIICACLSQLSSVIWIDIRPSTLLEFI